MTDINLDDYMLIQPNSINRHKKEFNAVDITVEDNHTFFILDENNNKLLTHNSDGAHITTLLLTYFYNFMRPLIENGHVFVAQPPLYKIKYKKKRVYAITEKEKNEITSELNEKNIKYTMTRFKGLGECNIDDIIKTILDKNTRVLKQMKIVDAKKTATMFKTLMGNNIPARKVFIQENATYANIDV